MPTRSERAATIAGALVAALSLGVVIYNALKPLLLGEDPWLIAAVTLAIVITISLITWAVIHKRRRSLAGRIKRR